MISDFVYSQPVKIFFGAGKFAGLHDVLSELGLHRCVVVCGRHFAPKAEELVSSMTSCAPCSAAWSRILSSPELKKP